MKTLNCWELLEKVNLTCLLMIAAYREQLSKLEGCIAQMRLEGCIAQMTNELISVFTGPAKELCHFSFQAHAVDAVSSSRMNHKNERQVIWGKIMNKNKKNTNKDIIPRGFSWFGWAKAMLAHGSKFPLFSQPALRRLRLWFLPRAVCYCFATCGGEPF